MDFNQRLKKKHILDLIAYLRTAKKSGKMAFGAHDDDDELEKEQSKDGFMKLLMKPSGQSDYFEHTLFLGVMPEEDAINHKLNSEGERHYEQQMAQVRLFEHGSLSCFDGTSFSFKRVWSKALIQQAYLSLKRYLRYIESSDFITNMEITKYNSTWMK